MSLSFVESQARSRLGPLSSERCAAKDLAIRLLLDFRAFVRHGQRGAAVDPSSMRTRTSGKEVPESGWNATRRESSLVNDLT
jgi:hypothetical protein